MTFEDKSIQELIDLTGNIYYTVKNGYITPIELHEVAIISRATQMHIDLKFYNMLKEEAFTHSITNDPFNIPITVYENIEDCIKYYLEISIPPEDLHPNRLKVIKDFRKLYGKIFPEELI